MFNVNQGSTLFVYNVNTKKHCLGGLERETTLSNNVYNSMLFLGVFIKEVSFLLLYFACLHRRRA